MSAKTQAPEADAAPAPPKKPSKKDQILSLWSAGVQEVSDLAHMTQTRPSYVAGVLHDAGLAQGRRVATHHAYEDDLAARGEVTVVRDARYVVDGNLVTSQGVSAGIDMALWLVGHIHGRPHARAVRRYIQYDPAPPYLADEPLT